MGMNEAWGLVSGSLKLFVVLGAGALALSGCGTAAIPEPQRQEDSLPAAATSEVTDEPTTVRATVPPHDVLYPYPVPEMPPEAYEHSVLGAQAFTVYFLQTFAYAMSIRDTRPLEEIMLPDSEFLGQCVELIDWLNETDSYYVGYYFEDMVVNGSLDGGNHPDAEYGTQVTVYVAEYTYVNGETGEEEVLPPERVLGGAEIAWRDDGWVVTGGAFGSYEDVYGDG
ncbi:MAG: DUF6318 family protein [Actinomycetaceae bacterium]|nr:DUF6318 family protein [Actinomycetaceae bacterium]